jgi:tape measure domain-containing protein
MPDNIGPEDLLAIKEIEKELKKLEGFLEKLSKSAKNVKIFSGITTSQGRDEIQKTSKTLEELRGEHKKTKQEIAKSSVTLQQYQTRLADHNRDSKLAAEADKRHGKSKNRLTAEVKQLERQLNKLDRADKSNAKEAKKLQIRIKSLRGEIDKMNRGLKKKKTVLGSVTKSLAKFAAVYIGIGTVVSVAKNIFETTKRIDSLGFAMKAAIRDSQELAKSQFFLNDITERFGINILDARQSYIKFSASVQASNLTAEQGRDIFESFAKVSGVLGLRADQTREVFLALEQMISKGTVSTEELRRQLGEKIPGAMEIMAKTLNVSVKELDKMLRSGDVLASQVLPEFAKQVEKSLGLETVERVETLAAAQERFGNAWIKLIEALQASDAFTNAIEALTDFVKSMQDGIQLEDFFEVREGSFIDWLMKNGALVVDQVKAFKSLFDAPVPKKLLDDPLALIDKAQNRRKVGLVPEEEVAGPTKEELAKQAEIEKQALLERLRELLKYNKLIASIQTDEREQERMNLKNSLLAKKIAFIESNISTVELTKFGRSEIQSLEDQFDKEDQEKEDAKREKERERGEAMADLKVSLMKDGFEKQLAELEREEEKLKSLFPELVDDITNSFNLSREKLGQEDLLNQKALLLKKFDQEQEQQEANFNRLKRTEKEKNVFAIEQALARAERELQIIEELGVEISAAEFQKFKDVITRLKRELGEEVAADEGKDGAKDIFDLLGIKLDPEGKQLVKEGFDFVKQQLRDLMALRVQLAEERVRMADQEVADAQRVLQAELTARNKGFADRVITARRDLAARRREQRQALQIRKEAHTAELRLQTIEQATSLATATAKIISSSVMPWIYIPLIALMWGTFIASKARAFSLTKDTAAEGDFSEIGGGSHASGNDTPVYGTGNSIMYAERGEVASVVRKRSVRKYGVGRLRTLHDMINSGRLDGDFLDNLTSKSKAAVSGIPISVAAFNTDMGATEDLLKKIVRQGEESVVYSDGKEIRKYKNLTVAYIS